MRGAAADGVLYPNAMKGVKIRSQGAFLWRVCLPILAAVLDSPGGAEVNSQRREPLEAGVRRAPRL